LVDEVDELTELHFSDAPKIIAKPPGPKARVLLEKQRKLDSNAVSYPLDYPTAWEAAKGATLKDVDGNTYIDLFAGVGVLNVGHSNPVVLEAVKAQADKIIHALDIPTEPRIKLLEKLSEIAPGKLKGNSRVFLGSPAGTDAVEAALKLAKTNTKRSGIIVFEGGYHGQTAGALALTSRTKFKVHTPILMPGVVRVPYAYCYRCLFEKEYPDCGLTCVNYIDHLFKDPNSGLLDIAAMVVEPIQGESGIIVPPDEFLQRLKEICEENEVLLIFDEIQSGFGRTGKMFACEHSNVTPDIIAISKSLGGIGLPIAGIIYRKELDVWEPGAHVGTFRGNVLACAAGSVAIKYLQQKKVLEHAERLGKRTMNRLQDLVEESKNIGEVRGKGLFIGVELVEDKNTKKPAGDLVKNITTKCFERGVVVWKGGHYGNVIRFLPPLVITQELMDKAIDLFIDVVKGAEKTAK
jgi:diaminobutyrate-2-oxoglutarate transaminase